MARLQNEYASHTPFEKEVQGPSFIFSVLKEMIGDLLG